MNTDDSTSTRSPTEQPTRTSHDAQPKKATDVKRVLACGTCRKRKLKCDSKRPKCSTCARLGHPCEYDEVRKKSGPKRGYVKSLEARLNQLESLLDQNPQTVDDASPPAQTEPQRPKLYNEVSNSSTNPEPEIFPSLTMHDNDLNLMSDFGMPVNDFPWDLVSLGLEEPLPSQDIMDDLYQIYFEKIHPGFPMLHRIRFLTSLNSAPNSRPPVCLRYIIFAHACSVDARYKSSAEQFYLKARKYIEQDEMRGHGESFITVAHAQAWNLIATYEFKYMYFPRAWLSVGRAARLCLMLGLHRQDRIGLDVKQTLPPPKDWVDKEERARTFWVSFCQDRYASIGTGWPMIIDEKDISTCLPASNSAYLSGTMEQTPMLSEAITGDKSSSLSAYGSVVLMATIFGRNLTHLHRPSLDERDDDLNGEFWNRHRSLDNILLNTALSLPSHLRLPQGINDPNIVLCNMNIHTSTICLHQAAIFKADKHNLAAQISSESKRRCLVAADQITSIMRMICHQDLSGLNPFMAFCLYVAARVFVQYLKFKKDDQAVKSSLHFLLNAMQALKAQSPLTESFLVQLDVDLESSGLDIRSPYANVKFANRPLGELPDGCDSVKCSPLFEIREQQAATINSGTERSGEMNFKQHDFDMGYFSNTSFDGGPQLGHVISNTLTPPFSTGEATSSASQSNQPTPAASTTNARGSIDSGTSPRPSQINVAGTTGKNYGSIRVKDMFLYNEPSVAPGAVVTEFNMNMDSEQASPRGQDPPINSIQPLQNLIDSSFGSTGLTPGPTGFSPWPSGTGMTPGNTGMTPGNTGMTPFSDWQTNNNGTDDNQWMFSQ